MNRTKISIEPSPAGAVDMVAGHRYRSRVTLAILIAIVPNLGAGGERAKC